MTYTTKLADGKYTVINNNGLLQILRHGEDWPGGDKLRHSGMVLAMAQRIEELEVAIKAVVDGPLYADGTHAAQYGLQSVISQRQVASEGLLREWRDKLRKVLEQRP